MNRRSFLLSSLFALGTSGYSKSAFSQQSESNTFYLKTTNSNAHFLGAPYPRSSIWSYNKLLPGPEIRAKQGETLQIQVDNQLNQATTLHCHGIRLPNDMDGVPELTQQPIEPDESFTYKFDLPDAGTYWYHPHFNSSEQVGRGLYGALIIEETDPIKVDKDIVLMLDDWRLDDEFQIQDNFSNGHDRFHAGRIGNTVTVNGRQNLNIPVSSGQRMRMRLINAANARTFSLDFSSHFTRIIAIDGHPVTPHEPVNGLVKLAAAMRIDIVVDMMEPPQSTFIIRDNTYRSQQHDVFTLSYSDNSPVRTAPLDSPIELAANTMPEPDINNAVIHEIELAGGAMGGMRGANLKGEYQNIRELARQGMVWAINGEVGSGHKISPLASLKLGETCLMRLHNNSAFDHPMHLHGHAFRVLSRDGNASEFREWQDTVNVSRNEIVEIAFVADNPGDWMFHCHVLEHQLSGMSSIIRIS